MEIYKIKYRAKILIAKFSKSQILLRWIIDLDLGSDPKELVAK
jgi:hypothetical protein